MLKGNSYGKSVDMLEVKEPFNKVFSLQFYWERWRAEWMLFILRNEDWISISDVQLFWI